MQERTAFREFRSVSATPLLCVVLLLYYPVLSEALGFGVLSMSNLLFVVFYYGFALYFLCLVLGNLEWGAIELEIDDRGLLSISSCFELTSTLQESCSVEKIEEIDVRNLGEFIALTIADDESDQLYQHYSPQTDFKPLLEELLDLNPQIRVSERVS